MKADKTLKIILLFIALGLFANAVSPLIQPRTAQAADDSFHCSGDLTAKAMGGTQGVVGGYNVDVTCKP